MPLSRDRPSNLNFMWSKIKWKHKDPKQLHGPPNLGKRSHGIKTHFENHIWGCRQVRRSPFRSLICDLVTIHTELFTLAMGRSPQARKYAHVLLRAARRHRDANQEVTEMFGDEVPIRDILTVFEIGDTEFDMSRCRPRHLRLIGRT